MIPFNSPPVTGDEIRYIQQALRSGRLCGDGDYGLLCQQWMEQQFNSPCVLLTPSCTASLEMAALLINIKPGDEVIMPSYTFVSTANAFVLRGARIVFIDIDPDTMNINAELIEAAITCDTRAIVPVHYAGVSCDMDKIMALAEQYQLYVIEDAAQGMMAQWQNRALGSIGHIGCISFHETKNFTAGGEGGAILINDPQLIERAEIIREKGTNRSQFFRGEVDKYTWRDLGGSFLMSDLQAAYLWAQCQHAEKITQRRLQLWQQYYQSLSPLQQQGQIELPNYPDSCQHNGHIFWIKLASQPQRSQLINWCRQHDILTVFHYIPLHSAPFGLKSGRVHGDISITSKDSERLLRLPLYFNLSDDQQSQVIQNLLTYFR